MPFAMQNSSLSSIEIRNAKKKVYKIKWLLNVEDCKNETVKIL